MLACSPAHLLAQQVGGLQVLRHRLQDQLKRPARPVGVGLGNGPSDRVGDIKIGVHRYGKKPIPSARRGLAVEEVAPE